jgi:hypothetical protein
VGLLGVFTPYSRGQQYGVNCLIAAIEAKKMNEPMTPAQQKMIEQLKNAFEKKGLTQGVRLTESSIKDIKAAALEVCDKVIKDSLREHYDAHLLR